MNNEVEMTNSVLAEALTMMFPKINRRCLLSMLKKDGEEIKNRMTGGREFHIACQELYERRKERG